MVLVNSNPATIMTDPEFADATYVEPITPEFVEKVIAHERPDALLATLGGQTALNAAMALHAGRRAREVRRRADRGLHRGHRAGREPRGVQEDRRGAAAEWGGEVARSAICHIHGRVPRRGRRATSATRSWSGPASPWAAPAPAWPTTRTTCAASPAPGLVASPTTEVLLEESILGWKEYELEVMRDTGRQRGDRLLHREPRPDGRAHRRLDHRRAGDDADRPRVPAHARPGDRHHPLGRRRHRRLQHPVRRQPRRRPPGRHRDEPAGLALLRAGLQGDRLPDRQDRRQGRHRLHPRRDPQRHHTAPTADPGRPSSRPWTTSWSRCRASPSRSSPAPTRR